MTQDFNVVSFFDGMSCGQLALDKLGISVTNYYACEIDKYAMQVTMKNFPNTIQLGDVTKVHAYNLPKINLLIGGSPCQGFSFAGKQLNFDDPRSKLFFEFVRFLKEAREINPDVKFLLENVKMKKEYQDVISEYLGVKPVEINSALVSAQNRKRLYWTNICEIIQPEDKGILLEDIIDSGFVDVDKAFCLDYSYFKGSQARLYICKHRRQVVWIIPEATKKGYVETTNGMFVDLTFIKSKTRRGRLMLKKSNCLTATNNKYCLVDKNWFRILTPIECERLQTVPDNYTAGVSNSQRYKMLGNGWTVDVITHILKNLINPNNMTQLKKRNKSFEASSETIQVFIDGVNFEAANLLKSGIKHQKIVLLNVNDVWHEIDVTDLGADENPVGANLNEFKSFVEQFSLKLSDLGIEHDKFKPSVDYELKQTDFEQLQSEFPKFGYIKIAILNSYMKESGPATGMHAIREILKMLSDKDLTIKDYIANNRAQKEQIINNDKSEIIEMKAVNQIEETPEGIKIWNRLKNLSELGVNVSQNGDFYEGYGFTITTTSVEEDSDEDWNSLIERVAAAAAAGTTPLQVGENNQTAIPVPVLEAEIIDENLPAHPPISSAPAPETAVKKPVSLETISNLSPDRISELQGLSELQNKIVAENPFVKITDAKTLKKAKEAESALLKASTSIDGTKGILTTFVTHANQFIKMGKEFLNPLAKITRDAYDKQKAERIAYENAAVIEAQRLAKESLEKMQNRTGRLFSIPMGFNGEIYSIGSLFILPSQIEKYTDEEFEAVVKQGESIKLSLEGAENAKDKEIRELKEKLAALGMLENMDNTSAPAPPAAPISELQTPPPAPAAAAPASPPPSTTNGPVGRFKPAEVYAEPNEGNAILSKFDLDHIEFISADPMALGFVKSRGYFIEGTKQVALKLKEIIQNPDKTVIKSVAITELYEILLNAKN